MLINTVSESNYISYKKCISEYICDHVGRIVLFGAGIIGLQFLYTLLHEENKDIKDIVFCDNNENKWGGT